jgi:hypothetical protein
VGPVHRCAPAPAKRAHARWTSLHYGGCKSREVSGNFVFMKNRHFFGVVTQENNEKKEERKGGERIVGGVPRFNIGTWGLCDRLCLVLVCRGRYGLGGGSSLHSRIEFGRSRTGEGSSGGRKRGVV